MDEMVLFEVPPTEPVGEGLSQDAARTQRQYRDVETGYHPLLAPLLGRNPRTKVHVMSPTDCAPDAAKNRPYTCGTCRFRLVIGHRSRSYPKCVIDVVLGRADSLDTSPLVNHSGTTDVRAWWPACQRYEAGDNNLSPDAARHIP